MVDSSKWSVLEAGLQQLSNTYSSKGSAGAEVDDAFEGQGVGSALARTALDDVRASGRSAVPKCPFIRGWIDKHPDYADLVAG